MHREARRGDALCCRRRCGAFCVGSTEFSRACANCNSPTRHRGGGGGRYEGRRLLLLSAFCFVVLRFDFCFGIAIDKQRPSPCLKVSWFFVFRALWRCLCLRFRRNSFPPCQSCFSFCVLCGFLLVGIPQELIAVLNWAWLSRSAAGKARNEKRVGRSEQSAASSPAGTQKQVLKALSGSQINALVKISTLLAYKCNYDYLRVKCLTGNNVQELFHNWTRLVQSRVEIWKIKV